jgi:hypothetical protein
MAGRLPAHPDGSRVGIVDNDRGHELTDLGIRIVDPQYERAAVEAFMRCSCSRRFTTSWSGRRRRRKL